MFSLQVKEKDVQFYLDKGYTFGKAKKGGDANE